MKTVFMLLAVMLISACGNKDYVSKYKQGDIVCSSLTGQRGQIVYDAGLNIPSYKVRFVDNKVNTPTMQTVESVREFELEDCK